VFWVGVWGEVGDLSQKLFQTLLPDQTLLPEYWGFGGNVNNSVYIFFHFAFVDKMWRSQSCVWHHFVPCVGWGSVSP
jgi:hypothetical protein